MGGVKLKCQQCEREFTVPNSRKATAKYCSRACSDSAPRQKHQVRCRECGTLFPQKRSQEKRSSAWGSFCSPGCLSAFRARNTIGESNPNFRGRNFDQHGYRIFTPQASMGLGLGRMKLHHATALLAVGLKAIPPGLHVHHRDCDVTNNDPSNLAFMTISDHKWLHKQFGVATLRAITSGKLGFQVAASWSDDPLRAEGLLLAGVKAQGVFMSYFRSKGEEPDLGRLIAAKPVRVEFNIVGDMHSTGRN